MVRSVARARTLLLALILVVAVNVVAVEAPAAPPEDRGWWGSSATGKLDKQPFGKGDARRMR